ncbi:MAG: glycosyltransferase [Candidatus Saccharibacteria bacterium]|nr:glycosyltransferase [Candidatus Saccharibacteria bacterium]
MKIAFFSDCYLDLSGGIVTVIDAEKDALEREGHTVYVFSSAYPKTNSELERLSKDHIFVVPSFRFIGRGLTPIARRSKIIIRWLKKHFPELKEFDCFYVHYEGSCSIAGIKLAKEYNIPSVQVMHGREDSGVMFTIPIGLRTIAATLLNFAHSRSLPHSVKIKRDDYLATSFARAKMWTLMVNHANSADFVITPSRHFLDKLLHYGLARPATALPHSLKSEYIEAKLRPKSLHRGEPLEIIWHSRVQKDKRIMPFLQAIALVTGKYHLSVYGDGLDLTKAKKYARIKRLNVSFYGKTSLKTLFKGLKRAHLDVLVSYNYDTFGMSLLEAAANATPILIVDPDLAEILPKGGYVLAKNPSPKAMATVIDEIISSPDRIFEMSQTLIRDFKLTKITDKTNQLIKIIEEINKEDK